MTYCVALRLNEGLVMLSDTRTNAGVDNISRYRKMFSWEAPGERVICLMCSGNLSITQGVITRIDRDLNKAAKGESVETILNVDSMFRVAQLVGDYMRDMQDRHRETLQAQGEAADASIILTGQRAGGMQRLFLIYSAGNFIEATEDTPYFQIGEHKYGKPILDRVITPATPMSEALNAVLVSMDSTIRSNLSVGMPLDLSIIRTDTYRFAVNRRIETDDETYAELSQQWSEAVRNAFHTLPPAPYL
ncbi:peptidase [Parvularcula flava]|uniref:Peptidase n=1 Tax=Aquisalinus luteolus TaxID=1566827 RepID=A0A8J3A8J0_9PROT|nr:peptidase [Aquisalinus luteolus]NHK28470.1 peptidase [Aquisalinus luteolus]GGH98576.1 peptidase [Aquisalinus luteolus]